jgi:hypothetical protein
MDTSVNRTIPGLVVITDEYFDWLKSSCEFLAELQKQMEEMEDTHTIVPNEILKELKRKEAIYNLTFLDT